MVQCGCNYFDAVVKASSLSIDSVNAYHGNKSADLVPKNKNRQYSLTNYFLKKQTIKKYDQINKKNDCFEMKIDNAPINLVLMYLSDRHISNWTIDIKRWKSNLL